MMLISFVTALQKPSRPWRDSSPNIMDKFHLFAACLKTDRNKTVTLAFGLFCTAHSFQQQTLSCDWLSVRALYKILHWLALGLKAEEISYYFCCYHWVLCIGQTRMQNRVGHSYHIKVAIILYPISRSTNRKHQLLKACVLRLLSHHRQSADCCFGLCDGRLI